MRGGSVTKLLLAVLSEGLSDLVCGDSDGIRDDSAAHPQLGSARTGAYHPQHGACAFPCVVAQTGMVWRRKTCPRMSAVEILRAERQCL